MGLQRFEVGGQALVLARSHLAMSQIGPAPGAWRWSSARHQACRAGLAQASAPARPTGHPGPVPRPHPHRAPCAPRPPRCGPIPAARRWQHCHGCGSAWSRNDHTAAAGRTDHCNASPCRHTAIRAPAQSAGQSPGPGCSMLWRLPSVSTNDTYWPTPGMGMGSPMTSPPAALTTRHGGTDVVHTDHHRRVLHGPIGLEREQATIDGSTPRIRRVGVGRGGGGQDVVAHLCAHGLHLPPEGAGIEALGTGGVAVGHLEVHDGGKGRSCWHLFGVGGIPRHDAAGGGVSTTCVPGRTRISAGCRRNKAPAP